MGTLHRITQKAMAALPETSCGTCLRIRSSIEGLVLAAETALSRHLGLAVGDKVSAEQSTGHMLCMEVEVPSRAETVVFLQSIGLTVPDSAELLGMSDSEFFRACIEQVVSFRTHQELRAA